MDHPILVLIRFSHIKMNLHIEWAASKTLTVNWSDGNFIRSTFNASLSKTKQIQRKRKEAVGECHVVPFHYLFMRKQSLRKTDEAQEGGKK